MKLSVIISCYAAEKMIERCISSLDNQTYPNIEVIVVDANSPDDTTKIIKEKFPHVILLERERIGVGEALNEGIKASTGEVIVIDFNTDEYAERDWAEELMKVHQKYEYKTVVSPTRLSFTGLVDGYGSKFGPTGGAIRIGYGSKYNPSRNSEECEFTGINTFPTRLIDKMGYIDEDYEFYGADTDFSLRARLVGYRIMTAPKAVTHHQLSASKSLNYRKFMSRMNFGIIRVVMIHGSKKRIIKTIGFHLFYYNLKALSRGFFNVFRRKYSRDDFEEIIGRIQGVMKIVTTLPVIIKRRKKFQKKLAH